MGRLAKQIYEFKMQMVRFMPFYGEVLLRVPIRADFSARTACTDGKVIYYNPDFFSHLTRGVRNYILLHEVLHIIFMHPSRVGERHPDVWNCAADLVVNFHVDQIMRELPENSVPLEKPAKGFFTNSLTGSTENLYENLLKQNSEALNRQKGGSVASLVLPTFRQPTVNVQKDLMPSANSMEGLQPAELARLIRTAAARGDCPTLAGTRELVNLGNLKAAKKKDWRRILREYLTEHVADETSYATPERKYIHMDMIIPGYCLTADRLEEVWAFVDTSGSISNEEMTEFLVQLYCIVREFRCRLNLCYWDTAVNEVYLNLRSEEAVLKSLSHSRGGTDINCIYSWLREKRIKPGLMLIMTDGYFGILDNAVFMPNLKSKTILIINNSSEDDCYRRIGKTVRL